MPTIHVTDRAGGVHRVEVQSEVSLMLLLKQDAGLSIAALCGGNCACATCHVFVADEWLHRLAPADETEREVIGQLAFSGPRSRLACQIAFNSSLDGLTVELAPEE
jgi:2Fe-2S ferredoxin